MESEKNINYRPTECEQQESPEYLCVEETNSLVFKNKSYLVISSDLWNFSTQQKYVYYPQILEKIF